MSSFVFAVLNVAQARARSPQPASERATPQPHKNPNPAGRFPPTHLSAHKSRKSIGEARRRETGARAPRPPSARARAGDAVPGQALQRPARGLRLRLRARPRPPEPPHHHHHHLAANECDSTRLGSPRLESERGGGARPGAWDSVFGPPLPAPSPPPAQQLLQRMPAPRRLFRARISASAGMRAGGNRRGKALEIGAETGAEIRAEIRAKIG